jgi:glucose/arabinose dehydrogenase/mono/diheme cytochrome c family protein
MKAFPAALAWIAFAGFSQGQLLRQANTTLVLPDSLPSATGYEVENALGSLTFNNPMAVVSVPGETHRLFVAQRGGLLRVVTNLSGTPAASTYLNLTSILGPEEQLNSTAGENGFLSVVFHPNFASNRTLFVYYTIRLSVSPNSYFQRLHRIVVSDATISNPAISSHEPMLTLYDRATNHNGGTIDFGPDGYLYLSLGDEGGSNDTYNNARFITQNADAGRIGFWGQMLRLDVDKKPENLTPNPHVQNSTKFPSAVHVGTYKIPADNPFIGATSWHNQTIDPNQVRTEIWATGLRNPFRWSFDKPTGRLFLGDVGQGAREEIDIIGKGKDYGWSWLEGNANFNSAPNPPALPGQGFNPQAPIYDYARNSSLMLNGYCVTGGRVYRGSRFTELYGDYIFADYGSGAMGALRHNGQEWEPRRLLDQDGIVGFGEDPRDGELLFFSQGSPMPVLRLKRSAQEGKQPPPLLSQVGAFSDLAALTPYPGIVPYEINVPFWSDHATKRRWFSIRNTTDTVVYRRDEPWTFPAGMVWIKHFDIETTRGNPSTRRKLETRVLVKTANSVYGLSYRWRADQSDADLVPETGMNDPLTITEGASQVVQTWRFPSRSECLACHTQVGGHALSFNSPQLNRDNLYQAQTLNQIKALGDAGYFSNSVTDIHTLPKYAPADDASQSLEWRVRSYFAVNCAQCHQPGGPSTGNWDARATVEMDAASIINGIVLNPQGNAASRFVVPGDPAHSVALMRLNGIPSRMPPVGSNVIDQSAVDLLTAWINQVLPGRKSFSEWQVAEFGLPLPPEAGPAEDPDGDGISNRAEYLAGTPPKAGNPSLLRIHRESGEVRFDFSLPANRSMQIEASGTLAPGSWRLWDVSGNSPFFPASGGARSLVYPAPSDEKRFFRGRISSP